jgi:uncharacterized membrane protein YedE/YeeE
MAKTLVALAAGLLFGLGLIVSGMIDPARVLGFLDAAGDWNPSLACVMGGAVGVAWVGFALAKSRPAPLCAEAFSPPARTRIDASLIAGAILFGIGWGLAGFCPGPALVGLSLGLPKAWLFCAAMVAGMAVWTWLLPARRR